MITGRDLLLAVVGGLFFGAILVMFFSSIQYSLVWFIQYMSRVSLGGFLAQVYENWGHQLKSMIVYSRWPADEFSRFWYEGIQFSSLALSMLVLGIWIKKIAGAKE